MRQLKALVLLLLSMPLLANTEPDDNDSLIAEGDWQVSLSVGAGRVSNPLIEGDALPLVLAPSIQYYGESFFFDNGTLGYTLTEQANFALSLTTSLNTNARYFNSWHPDNWFLSTVVTPSISQDENPDWRISYNEPNPLGDTFLPENVVQLRLSNLADRDWSLDAGVQLNWFTGENSQLVVQLNSDISNVHDGKNAHIEWNYNFAWQQTIWSFTLGADWQDRNLNSYYYGISERDKAPKLSFTEVGGTWLPFVQLSTSYRLNKDWSIVATVDVKDFSQLEEASLIVNESYQHTIFVGFRYDF